MTEAVKVRGVFIGSGCPKICVPVAAVSKEEIFDQAAALKKVPLDLAEWRADWYEEGTNIQAVCQVLKELRSISVSYTHLDVYKRQTLRSFEKRKNFRTDRKK